ncbi:MAG TPA: hypothetical protein VGC76_02520 [Pyrinomonadaceae bacterium]|jgi:hypothetical protein
MNASIIEYDTEKYNFREWASSVLRVQQLEKIHERADIKNYDGVVKQIRVCRDELYHSFNLCQEIYIDFIKSVIAPLFGGIHGYQIPPSFRFHYSQKGSSSFHRDRDYGVQDGRLNVWLPLTRVWGTNSIWIESEEGSEDFSPVELEYGQALIFDGANLYHGSKWNTTDSTRVSFDFRFAPGPKP